MLNKITAGEVNLAGTEALRSKILSKVLSKVQQQETKQNAVKALVKLLELNIFRVWTSMKEINMLGYLNEQGFKRL